MQTYMDELKTIINPKILEKAERHYGNEETFPTWRFKFEGLMALMGLDVDLEAVAPASTVGLWACA